MSSFMTHAHYLHSVLPHSENLKSVSKHPLVSWLWWCVPEISAFGRLKQDITSSRAARTLINTVSQKQGKPLQKPVLLGSAGWVFPQVFLF